MRVILATISAAFVSTAAVAAPIAAPGTEGFLVIAGGGEVVATYEGTTAAYTNLLYLDNGDSDFSNDLFLFNNQASPVGSTISLGSFAAGTELLFRLFVTNTGDNFFSGPATRNANGQAHNRVESNFGAAGTTLVSFEDLVGGPFDFNDLSFTFTNTTGSAPAVPVPASLGLLAGALLMLGAARRKRA